MSKKTASLLLCLIMLIVPFTLAGCGSKNSKNEVYFFNFKPESAEIYKEIAKKYEEEKEIGRAHV